MSAEIGTLEYWQEVAEAVTDDARTLRAELAALRAERDALRFERDKAEADYFFMVERAADQHLGGYRELASKCAALEERAQKAEAEAARLLGCRDELREIAEAIDDPRLHNTITIAEWCREVSKLKAPPGDLSSIGRSAFGDLLGHNYWMEATTFARLRRRIIEHWQRAALGER